jgi:hypothetical protein
VYKRVGRVALKLAALYLCLGLAPTMRCQTSGSIRGTVVDERGSVLSGAIVGVYPISGPTQHSIVREAETDAAGRFSLDRLDWGKYNVCARKEDLDYPNTFFTFYGDRAPNEASLTPASPTADVKIRVGPKAAILIGSVTNSGNGAPVNATFKLVRTASPGDWFSTSAPSSYRLLLPPSTDVLLEVTAPGFQTWSPGHPLRLQSGAELRLDVALQPAHDPSLHPSRFLVPEGYVGWILLEYNVKDSEPVSSAGNTQEFKFPPSGLLTTSSPGPQRGADDEYLYYASDGSLRQIPRNYASGKGMVWGQYEGSRKGVTSQFGFFVGTEEQYKKFQSQATHPGPVATP